MMAVSGGIEHEKKKIKTYKTLDHPSNWITRNTQRNSVWYGGNERHSIDLLNKIKKKKRGGFSCESDDDY